MYFFQLRPLRIQSWLFRPVSTKSFFKEITPQTAFLKIATRYREALTSKDLFKSCSFFLQGDFDAYEYVERLASTVVGGGSKGGAEAFDPKTLSDVFEKTIKELTALDEKMQGRINKLEELCAKEQEEHKQKAKELEKTFKVLQQLTCKYGFSNERSVLPVCAFFCNRCIIYKGTGSWFDFLYILDLNIAFSLARDGAQ